MLNHSAPPPDKFIKHLLIATRGSGIFTAENFNLRHFPHFQLSYAIFFCYTFELFLITVITVTMVITVIRRMFIKIRIHVFAFAAAADVRLQEKTYDSVVLRTQRIDNYSSAISLPYNPHHKLL